MSEIINFRYLIHLELKGPRAVVDWCMEHGLMAAERLCSECGGQMTLMARTERSEGFDWHCRKKGHNEHRSKVSVRDNSVFYGGKVPIMRMISMMYCWANQYQHADAVRECMVSSITMSEWERICRELVVEDLSRKDQQIGGEGVVVEVDEWDFGRPQRNDTSSKWLYSGIERKSGANFFAVAEERSREALLSVVKDHVRSGSTVVSSLWKSHDCRDYEGFTYLGQRYNLKFVESDENDEQSAWGDLREGLDTTENHIKFLEHVWRLRHAKSRDVFLELMNTVRRVYTPKYKQIVEAENVDYNETED